MVLQGRVERALVETFPNFFAKDSNKDSTKAKAAFTLASSAFVGALSSPFLAVYNGKTMIPPWSVIRSLSEFSAKQACAITLQETGFVAGLAAADLASVEMKKTFGDSTAVEYSAAAVAGALGSLFGHAGNTALTRWQSGMNVQLRHLPLGALQKARGNALFTLLYTGIKRGVDSTVEGEK